MRKPPTVCNYGNAWKASPWSCGAERGCVRPRQAPLGPVTLLGSFLSPCLWEAFSDAPLLDLNKNPHHHTSRQPVGAESRHLRDRRAGVELCLLLLGTREVVSWLSGEKDNLHCLCRFHEEIWNVRYIFLPRSTRSIGQMHSVDIVAQ